MRDSKQPKAGTEQRRSVQKEARDYRRFIEESFPVKEVGEASSREKNIRHGHISTLHIWWARRPLAASRATAYAALTPAPKDDKERDDRKKFIIQLCQWENSNNQSLLERARREILEANGGVPPKVLDPFSGGGSYPLEALRLGCESYANDYNPVAVLIEKATLEYPQKFGHPFEGMPEWAKSQRKDANAQRGKGKKGKEKQLDLLDADSIENPKSEIENPLLNAVRYWGEWMLEEVRKELAEFYPPDSNGNIPIGYIWAHAIPCQNPNCGEYIPLIKQYWLARKPKFRVALFPQVKNKKLSFMIVGDESKEWPKDFTPENGIVSKAVATCPICGTVIDANTTRQLFKNGKSIQKMIALVLQSPDNSKKVYRVATQDDIETFNKSNDALEKKCAYLLEQWGLNPVPDEPISKDRPSPNARGTSAVTRYGLESWGDLFNKRQLLSFITLTEKVRAAHKIIEKESLDHGFAVAVSTYLAFIVSRLPDTNSILCHWDGGWEKTATTFARQALSMNWDYIESNVLGEKGYNIKNILNSVLQVLERLRISSKPISGSTNSTATNLPYEDNYFDAILTDPPYYDNVPYSHLADFFYVWLKRSLNEIHPDLFITPLTPKSEEIVAYTLKEGGFDAGKKYFEENLKRSFQEMERILKPNGIAIIVYAHKSTEGWETVINALLDSKLVVSGAWPLNTEMKSRVNANETASLASSIYIVARKVQQNPTGFYNDVRAELTQHLDIKLHRLWEEGIGGGDFFIAAIGSAIEVFGKYEQVMDFEGNIVRANRLLEEVRVIATNYAVKQILHDEFVTEVTPMARFYVLWRWNYGEALVPFDEANRLGHSCGLDVSLQFTKGGFIKKEKEFARLLGPQDRKLDDLDDPRDMIDVLHKSLLLWENGQRAEMVKALSDRGFGKSEAFYRVAQAISETLPLESKEKKLLDGFLAGRDRVQQEVEKEASQERLL